MAGLLTLREAVQILGIDADTSRSQVNIQCPICGQGSRQKKLNIAFDKLGPDDGLFRCAKCGFSGKALHLWAQYRGIYDLHDASVDYHRYKRENGFVYKPQIPTPDAIARQEESSLAPVKTRNETYSAFLDMLTLSEKHKQSLLSRGLSQEAIQKAGYRSYPVMGKDTLVSSLLKNGYTLEGVPGFYQSKGSWAITRQPSCIIIPQRDGFGRIQGCQFRYDNPEHGRYKCMSSKGYENGTGAKVFCHLAKGKSLREVILTEGPLKADIISYFTGYTVLAVPGVNSTSYLPQALQDLKKNGMEQILIAFDMDLYENEFVEQAFFKLKKTLYVNSIPYRQLIWDISEGKGLDDWLLQKVKDEETQKP